MSLILPACGTETTGEELVGSTDVFTISLLQNIMRDLSWETLDSEYLFRDSWFTVRKDTCKTKQGKIVTPYYVYEFPTWVTAVALTEDKRIILERQYRHALNETNYEIPGGCVDDTDASLEAAIERELLEETGYRFSQLEYLGKTSSNPSTNNNWMHMFLATGGKKVQEQTLDHNEEIEIYLFTIDEVKQYLRENRIIQSMHVTALFYGLARLGVIQY
jgi:8-oxo-dGTP pyrophosphatase MutT (NUDIX family)